MEAIAQAWSDPSYFTYLTKTASSGQPDGVVITPVGTPQATWRDRFVTFENPWAFNIVFIADKSSRWVESGQYWEGLSYNQIFLNYPQPPSWENEIHKVRAVAISRYNGLGLHIPFLAPDGVGFC